MICRRCLRAALQPRASRPISRQPLRALTTTAPTNATTSPAATVTTAGTSSQSPDPPRAKDAKSSTASAGAKSSVAAGTVLKGLNFIKGQQDPVALEDKEYPAWLWGILKSGDGKDAGAGALEGDLFSKSKKQRRIAAKALRKQQLTNPGALAPKIPLYEQSIDLPSGDGSFDGAVDAGEARGELTKAMRAKRRSGIKEGNFLKAMR